MGAVSEDRGHARPSSQVLRLVPLAEISVCDCRCPLAAPIHQCPPPHIRQFMQRGTSIGGDEHSAARCRRIIEVAAGSVSRMKPGLQAPHQFGDSREQHAISVLDESMAERWGEMRLAAAARTCGSCLRSCRPGGKLLELGKR